MDTPEHIKADVEVITPERAAEMLGRAEPNRHVRSKKIERFAADIAAGRWLVTGEAIKLTSHGKVIDGEHRLRAVIAAGVPITSLVVHGVPLENRIAMDTGTSRSFADHLALLGETRCKDLASAVAAFWREQNEMWQSNDAPSHSEALVILESHPGLRWAVEVVDPASRKLRIPRGTAASLFYVQDGICHEDAVDFWQRLETGFGRTAASPQHPVHRVREQLIANHDSTHRKADRVLIHAWLRKAWNFYREGREVAFIKWVRGGASPEAFPVVLV